MATIATVPVLLAILAGVIEAAASATWQVHVQDSDCEPIMTDSFTTYTAASHPPVPCQVLRVAVRLLMISGIELTRYDKILGEFGFCGKNNVCSRYWHLKYFPLTLQFSSVSAGAIHMPPRVSRTADQSHYAGTAKYVMILLTLINSFLSVHIY